LFVLGGALRDSDNLWIRRPEELPRAFGSLSLLSVGRQCEGSKTREGADGRGRRGLPKNRDLSYTRRNAALSCC